APGAFKARDEADQGALAAAGRANHDSQLAAFDSEGAAADDFLRESVGAVRLANVLDDDLAADRGREYGAGRIRSLRLNNIFRCHPKSHPSTLPPARESSMPQSYEGLHWRCNRRYQY